MILTGLIATGALAAWIGHTEASRAMAVDLADAFSEHSLKRIEVVAAMELTNEPQLSRQLAGAEPLNLFRLAALPDDVKLAFYRRQVARLGGVVLDRTQASLLRGAAVLGVRRLRRMARIDALDQSSARRHA